MAFSINQKNNDITLVRGDYLAIVISMRKSNTEYIPTEGTLRFAVKMRDWYTLGLYDVSKNVVQVYESHDIADSTGNEVATGTLNSSRIPSTAKYVVLVGNPYNLSSNTLSLIRTA